MTTDTDKPPAGSFAPSAAPQPQVPRLVKHRKAIIATVIGMVMVAGCFGIGQQFADPPASIVTAYLNAIRDGDVDTALENVRMSLTEEDMRFLTPEALSNDWELAGVTEYESEGSDRVVAVELTAHGTKNIGKFNTTQDSTGEWYIENPFVEIDFTKAPFDFAQLNGVTGASSSYPLFPGAYEFYEDHDALTLEGPTELLVPKTDDSIPPGFEWEPKPEAEQQAQEAADADLDTCAESTSSAPSVCPFGFVPGHVPAQSDDDAPFHIKNVEWDLVEYPEIEVQQEEGDRLGSPAEKTFSVETTSAGMAVANGTEFRDGKDQPFRAECEFETAPMYAYIDSQYELRLSSPLHTELPFCTFSRKDV